jgi:DHA1 family bicyclomycin/chloramphenicol resistance-like MFS transporter
MIAMRIIDWPDVRAGSTVRVMRLSPRHPFFTILLGALSALPPLSIDVSLPTLPTVAGALGATASDVQGTLSAFLTGFALGQLVHGPAADRFGRRPVLLGGLALYVAAGIACTAAGSIAVLVAMRFFQGLGACAGIIVARAMVRDRFEGVDAAAKQSVLSSVSTLAMLGAPIVGGVVLSLGGWRAVYGVLPAAGLVLLAAASALGETRPDYLPVRRFGAGYARVLGEPRVLGHVAVNALLFGGMFAYISGSPLVLLGAFGVTPRGFGFFFAITAIAALAGAQTNRALVRRVPPATLTTAALGLAACAVIVLGVAAAKAPSLAIVVGAMAAYTFACAIVFPNGVAAAMAPLPDVAGAAAAVIGFTQFAVGAASAALIGAFRPGTVVGMAAVIAAFAAAALLVAAWMRAAPAPVSAR